jgi:pyruvate/2-oxoglutarate dehydrogenase complex dihydrolipoamide dehydrogenase (E3) component
LASCRCVVSAAAAAAAAAVQAVVVGGGYIGLEVAAGLSLQGLHVTMVFPEQHLVRRGQQQLAQASAAQQSSSANYVCTKQKQS